MNSVSVIIPVRNGARYIREAIDSVLAQTQPAFEVIVIDDGSTDNLPEVLASYRNTQQIVYLRTEGVGTAAARNLGIKQAAGDLIGFLDADDRWAPNKLELQVPLFNKAEVALTYTNMNVFGVRSGGYKELEKCTFRRGVVIKELLRENFVPTSTVIARKTATIEAGGFIEDKINIPIGEDYYLWIMIASRHEFDYLDLQLTNYRTHESQSSRKRSASYASVERMFKELLRHPNFNQHASILHERIREFKIKKWIYRLLCQ